MLTVKLCKGSTTKIVEATEVNIYNSGPSAGSDVDPRKRTGEVREVTGTSWNGNNFAFYVADPHKTLPKDNFGFAPQVDFWGSAYIENAHGATTEVVRAY
jgi:hypothetical protein